MCTQRRLGISLGIQSVRMNSHNMANLVISIIFLSHNGARNSQNFITIFNNIFTVIHVSLFLKIALLILYNIFFTFGSSKMTNENHRN